MDEASLGEEVPDAAIEHASVEVDAFVPRLQHKVDLVVDQHLLVLVVGFHNIHPVVKSEEIMSSADHLLK